MTHSFNHPARFSGMTLLEILIALSLMVVLLGFVWGMVTLFSTDYLAGEKRAGRAQLVRSISQMLSDDLGAAVQDPVHPTPSEAHETIYVRRFGLHGDETSLQIDVIQPNLLVESATLAENRAAASSSSKPVRPQVPELKTVFYEFIPPNALRNGENSRDSSGRSQTQIELARKFGLSRKELSYEAPDPAAAAEENHRQNSFSNQQTAAPQSEPQPYLSAAQLAMEIDDNTMWMPEVVDCRFRYYDGKNWLSSWDSIKKNGLPTAIEAQLKLLPLDDVETLRTSPLLYRLAYPSYRFDLNASARSGNGAVTLESAAEFLRLSPIMTREVIVSLPITPLAMHKALGRRKPLPAVKGEVGRRSAGGAESSAAASGDWIGGRTFTGQGDLFPVSGPGGEGESFGGLVTPGQAASPSPFDRIDSLVSGFDPSSGAGFDGMLSSPAGTPVPAETTQSVSASKPGVQQQWLRGRR